jgi:Domain of unknown function (DUF1992)
MLDFLAERRIAEAVSRGELDDLPGAGRPLDLDDDRLVPEDLRAANRILKNAGVAPPEVKKLGLMKVRVESRYYAKVRAKLAR